MAEVEERWIIPIKEFWRRQDMSYWKGQKLIKQGIGPRITRIGAKVFVTVQDELEWRNMMRNPHGRAAEIAAATAKMLHEKAKHANSCREDRQ